MLILLLLGALQLNAQITRATLQASGLTCALCSKAVFKALSAVPFVEKVEPNIKLSTYEISFKRGAKIDLDALGKAVVNAGFSVAQLRVTTSFKDTKVGNDVHVTLNNQLFHFIDVPSQTLNGDKTISLIDKDFVTAKEFKKYEKLTALKCYQTGTMDGQRVYHVTL